MPFELSPMTASEMEEFMQYELLALGDLLNSLYDGPLSQSSIAERASKHRETLEKDPNTFYLKVTTPKTTPNNPEAGTDKGGSGDREIIAAAKWSAYLVERTKAEFDEANKRPEWVPEQKVESSEKVYDWLARNRWEIMGTRPHYREYLNLFSYSSPLFRACVQKSACLLPVEFTGLTPTMLSNPFFSRDDAVLSFIATRPEYRGQGAGRILLKWGLDKADRDGLEAFLESSTYARPIYARYGFEPVRSLERFDCTNDDPIGPTDNAILVRKPRKANELPN